MARFDVDNRDPGKEYAIPPDNPFINDPSALPQTPPGTTTSTYSGSYCGKILRLLLF